METNMKLITLVLFLITSGCASIQELTNTPQSKVEKSEKPSKRLTIEERKWSYTEPISTAPAEAYKKLVIWFLKNEKQYTIQMQNDGEKELLVKGFPQCPRNDTNKGLTWREEENGYPVFTLQVQAKAGQVEMKFDQIRYAETGRYFNDDLDDNSYPRTERQLSFVEKKCLSGIKASLINELH
jgi:uncharacterized protein YceK